MKKILMAVLVLCLCFAFACAESAEVSTTADVEHIAKYGNVQLDYLNADFLAQGYEYGDVVTVSFLDQTMDIPFCSNYSDVDSGTAGLFACEGDEYLLVAINMGDFATTYGIGVKTTYEDKTFTWDYAEGIEGPVAFTISMAEKGGYHDQYVVHSLTRTDVREDYADLTDEQFANFRAVTTTGMGEGVLYRSSSPVNPSIGRDTYADEAFRAAGVNVIMNLSDDEEALLSYEYGEDNVYTTAKYIALNMGVDFTADDFRAKLAEGLRFFAANDGIYGVHCNDGKDRTGFVSALLECLMGATYEEVTADYMVTYFNYYGVMEGDGKYDIVLNSNIVKTLCAAFGVTDLQDADLAACAEQYILGTGLTEDEIATLKANLSA